MSNEELLERVRELTKKDGKCPSCGRCNECGHTPNQLQPIPYVPYTPTYPQPYYPFWYWSGGTISDSTTISGYGTIVGNTSTVASLPAGSSVSYTV